MIESAGAGARPSILIAAATADERGLLRNALAAEYAVRTADCAAQTLRSAGADPQPDLILLDTALPETGACEVLRALQADAATRAIPVVLLAGAGAAPDEARGLALGAADYVRRPFGMALVKARLRTHLELRALRRLVNERLQQLVGEREQVEETLARMRRAGDFDARHLRYLMTSVDKTTGDILFAALTPDGRRWVLVGDMAGHGPVAALGIPFMSYIFYRCARRGCVAEDMLAELNGVAYEQLPPRLFMAFCLVEVLPGQGRLRIWNGGLPGCVLRAADGSLQRVEPAGFPLGVAGQLAMEPGAGQELAFTAGSRLYLFTDGLTELPGAAGGYLGMDGVVTLLAGMGAPLDPDRFRSALDNFHGGGHFPDDLTLVEIEAQAV
jgi:DNA-binding response OmpR family regulator